MVNTSEMSFHDAVEKLATYIVEVRDGTSTLPIIIVATTYEEGKQVMRLIAQRYSEITNDYLLVSKNSLVTQRGKGQKTLGYIASAGMSLNSPRIGPANQITWLINTDSWKPEALRALRNEALTMHTTVQDGEILETRSLTESDENQDQELDT